MKPPFDTLRLFPVLNNSLVTLLRQLDEADWQRQTIAKKWVIKDVATHLLDGNFRRISLHRDNWQAKPDRDINFESDLVQYLNQLNADWVIATKRLSPRLITDLLESTNETVFQLFSNLDPLSYSIYPVSWAGETKSFVWFDTAREYSERWLHQQQIRQAMGNTDLLSKQLYKPLLDIFMYAWQVSVGEAREGTVLRTRVTGDGGGVWELTRSEGKWKLSEGSDAKVASETIIDGAEAWKLFSKSKRKEDIQGHYEIKGRKDLGEKVLDMISVMA
jgi:predicted secreted protein